MKLEAAWILTNIAYGKEDVLTALMTPQVMNLLNSLLENPNLDIQMLDQIIFLVANLSGDNSTRAKTVKSINPIDPILRVLGRESKIPISFADNFIWVADNYCEEYRDLNLKQVKGLSRIFYEFLEYFYKENKTRQLQEITKGLSKLASSGNSVFLDQAAGLNFDRPGVIIDIMVDLLSSKDSFIYKYAL
jgi:hypothetical protein